MTDRIPPRAIEATGYVGDGAQFLADDGTWTKVGGVPVVSSLPAAATMPDQLVVLTSGSATTDPMLGADGLHPTDAGMTHLADAYEDALNAAGKTPAAGTALYAYGDSWTASDINNTPGLRAIEQLRDRLSLTLTNRAVSGDMMADVAARAIGVSPFVAGTAGLAVIANAGLNDLKHADTTVQRATLTTSMRALFAVICAAERIEETAFTYTGTWTVNSISVDSGGANRGTQTEGATATYAITTPGTYYLLSNSRNTSTPNGGVLTISQGGTTLATLDLDDSHVNTSNLLTSNFGPTAVRVDGVAAGTLTVTYSNAGRTNAFGYLDALVRVSPTPPTILAVKPVPVLASNYQNDTLLAFTRDLYDTMAAEFGATVVIADPSPGWAPDGTYSTGTPELWYSDGATWTQPTASAGTPTLSLDDLSDVSAAAPSDGYVLTYDTATGTWTPEAAPSVGATALDDLTDVDTTTTAPADGQVLKYDAASGTWLPADDAAGSGSSGDAAWTHATYQNGFSTFSSTPAPGTSTGFFPARFRKDGSGVVHLSGIVKGGSNGATIFTLPAGYRPAGHIILISKASGTTGSIDVLATGEVQMGSGSTTWLSLDGISFYAEA